MKSFKRWLALMVVFAMIAGLGIHQFGNSFRANESAAPAATEATEENSDSAVNEVTEATEVKSVKTDEAVVSETPGETAVQTEESAAAGKQEAAEAKEPEKAEYTISIKEPEKDGGSVFASSEGSMKKVSFSGGLYNEKVAEGEAFELQIKTGTGYQVDNVEKQDGSLLEPVLAENGTYSYKIDNVTSDIQLTVTYEEIKAADSHKKASNDGSENKKENNKAESSKDNKVNKANDDKDGDVTKKDSDKSDKPAQTIKAAAGNAVITVTAPEGALPAGATVKAVNVNSFVVENSLKKAADEDGLKLTDYDAYDITIYDKDGRKIQPDDSVKVTVSGVDVKGNETAVYHISSGGVEKVDGSVAGNTVSFDAEQFSIYAVAMNDEAAALEGTVKYLMVWYRVNDRNQSGTKDAVGVKIKAVFPDEKTVSFELAGYSDIEGQWKEHFGVKDKNVKRWDVGDVDNGIGRFEQGETCTVPIEGKEISDGTPYVTVYPVYEDNETDPVNPGKILLSFEANGAEGNVPETIIEDPGTKVKLPGQSGMTYEGRTFMGWGLKKDTGHTSGYGDNAKYTIYPAGYEWTLSLTENTTLYAVWAGEERAKFFVRLDGQIPTEPCQGGEANYTDQADGMFGSVTLDTFYSRTDGNGVADRISEVNRPTTEAIRKACNAKVGSIHFNDRTEYTKCDSDKEFEDNYYVLWYVIKTENSSHGQGKWVHVDGVLLQKTQYKVTYSPGCDVHSGDLPKGTTYAAGTKVIVKEPGNLSRPGYTFDGWEYNSKIYAPGYTFTMPEHDVDFVAKWKANNNTMYKTEHYLLKPDNPDNSELEPTTTVKKYGNTGDEVTAEPINFPGYELVNTEDTVASGMIAGDGSLVLKLYYMIDEDQKAIVKYESESVVKGEVTNSDRSDTIQKVTGEGTINGSTATAKRGYEFNGWYVGDKKVSDEAELTPGTVGANLNKTRNGTYETYEIYEDTTFTAKFVVDPSQTVPVTYKPESENMGSVTPSNNMIEVATAKDLTGSTATAATGYKFTGWYVEGNDQEAISAERELTAEVAKAALNKTDGTYDETTFIAKFEKDTSQTQDTKYTVRYTIEGVEQISDKVEVNRTAWVNDSPAKIAIADGGIPTPIAKYQGYKPDPNNPQYPVAGTEVISGTVYTVNYVRNSNWTKPTNYTVKHVVDGVEQTADTRTYTSTAWINERNPMIGIQSGSVDAKAYTGYKLASISPDVKAGMEVESGSTITLTYVKNDADVKTLEYTVKYVADGVDLEEPRTYTKTVWVNENDNLTIKDGTIDKKSFKGYKFKQIDPDKKVGDEVADKAVITLTYEKDESQTQRTQYTVRHVIGETVQDTKTYNGTAWINDEDPTIKIESGSLAEKKYKGYKFDSIDTKAKEGDEVANGTVITLKYIRDDSQTQDTSYTVKHVVDGVEQTTDTRTYTSTAWINELNPMIAIKPDSLAHKTYKGYKFDSISHPDAEEEGMVANGTVITLNYIRDDGQTQDTSYTVKHVVDGVEQTADTRTYTSTAWINDQNPMIQIQSGSVDAKSYTGYKFASISPEVIEGDKVTSGDTITLTYVKDDQETKELEYTVKYVVGGIERPELTQKYIKSVWVNEKDNTLEIQDGSIDKMDFDGYKFESITDDVKVGDKVASGKTITLNYVADFAKLDAEGFEKPYDGKPSSVSLTGTIAGDKIEFLTNARNADDSFTAVNVGDSAEKLTVKVTRGNETWTKEVKAVITPLDVTLKSADIIKMYDGSALTNGDTALETEDGFIPGEGAEYTFTGSRTEVGSSENTFTYELKEGTLAENYNITAEPGTLTITPVSDNPIVTPGGNDAPPVTPTTVIRTLTGAPPAVANFLGGALQNAGASVRELVVSEDDEVPLANMKGEHKCCIFHFLLILVALILLALYTRNMKKRQEELFELRRQIDEERAAQGLPPVGEDRWIRK